jgi:AcrR family transcriptional regulator
MATRKKPASRYHHGDLRTALIGAAWTVVSKKGVDALSLRSVAEAVGVSYAAPAHHFPNKEALIDALQEEAWKRFADALHAAVAASPSRNSHLRELGRAYVDFATKHPAQMRLMFRPTQTPCPSSQNAWAALVEATETPLDAAVAWAMVHGVASLLTDAPLPKEINKEELVERALRVVAKGL